MVKEGSVMMSSKGCVMSCLEGWGYFLDFESFWSEVKWERGYEGGQPHRDSILMDEVDLNHQSLVIGRLLYLTTSASRIWTQELPIGKQEC